MSEREKRRQERLAKQLRSNLMKRKAQARERHAEELEAETPQVQNIKT